jgi:hypothetical protein
MSFLESSHDCQNPSWAVQSEQRSVSTKPNSRFVIQLSTDELPRKDVTTSLFVLSMATKPVTSVSSLLLCVSSNRGLRN